MATQARRALFRHLGLKLLEHAAVEMRETKNGFKYAALKVDESNLNGVSFLLTKPDDVVAWFGLSDDNPNPSVYRNYYGSSHVIYPDAPLRLEGYFYSTLYGRDRIYRFEVTPGGGQLKYTYAGGRASREELRTHSISEASTYDLRPLKSLRELNPQQRRDFMLAVVHRLTTFGVTEPQVRAGYNHRDALETLGIRARRGRNEPAGAPQEWVRWRTGLGVEPMPAYEWLQLKGALKEMGHYIGSADADVEEFISKFHDFRDVPNSGYFNRRLSDAWSRRHPESELVSCTCGHLEVEHEALPGVGRSTVCRECVENGTWVMVEDLGTYGAAYNFHQHDDGLYYSYSEPDSDDEQDEYTGIRGYSSDVRSFLRSDKAIKPSPYGEFLMGIELEVVPDDYQSEAARHTMKNLAAGYAILKSDGSLSEGGFEIVTAPRGLKEHVERFGQWKPYSTLRAWDAGCCGMHVHISSQAFNASTLGKFIEFINSKTNDEFIHSIAGRHPRWDQQATHYCQRDGCTPGNPKKTLEDKCSDRYFMVNTTNVTRDEALRLGMSEEQAQGRPQNTIELRVFRASLKKARLLAQIEFAHAAVMFCRWSSMRELDGPHFLKWLQDMAGLYPNLAKWYGVRSNTKAIEEKPKVRAGADV